MDTKKIYLPPRIKTLKIKAEDILNLASVNGEVGDGNQLSKEMNFDDEEPANESVWE